MNNLEEYEECSTWSRDFSIPPSLSWSRLPVQPLKFVTAHLFEWEKDEMAVPYLNQGRQRLQLAGLQWLAEKYRNSSTLMLLESKSKFIFKKRQVFVRVHTIQYGWLEGFIHYNVNLWQNVVLKYITKTNQDHTDIL